MDEFIDNFNEFKTWLYNEYKNTDDFSVKAFTLQEVIDKFEQLGLNDAF